MVMEDMSVIEIKAIGILFKAIHILKDPKDMIWILGHLDDILENAGLSSLLIDNPTDHS